MTDVISHLKPLKLNSSEVNIWFTSDLHFGHRNIMKFCNRPWETVEEMDKALINNWNSVVGKNDIVFDLGDFAFASNSKWKYILNQLNGRHYLILGNHDVSRYPGDKTMELFERVEHQMIVKIDDRYVYLNHYPYLCYGGSWRGPENAVYALHGHTHLLKTENSGKDFERMSNTFPYQYDVGVDFNNYKPISWEKVCEKITFQVNNNVNQMYWVNS